MFTTSVVAYPELQHIGEDKDFTPVIEKALECGGYKEDQPMTGINGGTTVTTGFGHGTVLENAGKIIDLVKKGKIKHFFLSVAAAQHPAEATTLNLPRERPPTPLF